MDIEAARIAEHRKYAECYKSDNYRMGGSRKFDAFKAMDSIRGDSFLDVGCGRGEMLQKAEELGFKTVHGVEVVPDLIDGVRVVKGTGQAIPFPDKSFDVVTMMDVIEHLIPGDEVPVCKELERVAKSTILLTANNRPSVYKGADLHINIKPYEDWDKFFREIFSGTVTRLPASYVSEMWRIDF